MKKLQVMKEYTHNFNRNCTFNQFYNNSNNMSSIIISHLNLNKFIINNKHTKNNTFILIKTIPHNKLNKIVKWDPLI